MIEQPTAQDPHALSDSDREHLRLLSIFHYVVAAMMFLFCSFPLLHVAIGLALVTGSFPGSNAQGEQLPEAFGWLFVAFPGAMVLSGWSLAAAMVVAGRRLSKMESRMFCLVVAAVGCMFMPIGTALGVFTIIVLMRPSVQLAFSSRSGH